MTKKTKKTTIRFYTVSDRYVEWKYLNETTYFEIKNWIRDHNYILIGEQRIDINSPVNSVFALLRRKK